MTSVFVTGASGYIGQHVAIAFRSAGYRVYGLVRSQEKGAHLVRHEVIPVVGDINNTATYQDALDKSTIVVDTVLDFTQKDPLAANKTLLEATAKSGATIGVSKTYIYTSGVLVYAHSEEVRDENSPLPGDHDFFKARIAFENETLKHTGVRGIVIRPGFVYGGASGAGNHLTNFFSNAEKDKIVLNNTLKNQRWNWIHVVDLADSYVRAAKQSHTLKGEAFNIVSTSSPTYEQITLAAAKVAGFKGTVEYTDALGSDFLTTLGNKTVLLTHYKARDLLGWTPNHSGVLEELDIYYHTIKGSW